MQFLSLIALPLLASAAPTIIPRAGAPTQASLPADCPIDSAWPSGNSSSFTPTDAFNSANGVYSYSLTPGSTYPDGTDDEASVKDCLETCYGFGNPGTCKSVWTAHKSSVMQRGGSTTQVEFVCRLFGKDITEKDLGTPAAGGEDVNAHAMSIGCTRQE